MTRPAATLTFAGAAATVTGSKHLLECGKARILLECALATAEGSGIGASS